MGKSWNKHECTCWFHPRGNGPTITPAISCGLRQGAGWASRTRWWGVWRLCSGGRRGPYGSACTGHQRGRCRRQGSAWRAHPHKHAGEGKVGLRTAPELFMWVRSELEARWEYFQSKYEGVEKEYSFPHTFREEFSFCSWQYAYSWNNRLVTVKCCKYRTDGNINGYINYEKFLLPRFPS